MHTDSGEVGGTHEEKEGTGQGDLQWEAEWQPSQEGWSMMRCVQGRGWCCAMGEGWVPTWSLGPVCRPVLQLSSLRISVMGQENGRQQGH